MRIPLILLSFGLILLGCQNQSKLNKEAEALDIDLEIVRFDQKFAQTSVGEFSEFKAAYPDIFPEHIPDSLWIAKLESDLQEEINKEVQTAFPDFEEESERIERFFKYVKYHFPDYRVPTVYTLAEEVNYRTKLVLSEDKLLISLDNYLGPEHKFYQSFPKYIAFQQDQKFLVSDVAEAFIHQRLSPERARTFIAEMVYHGKILYLKDVLMPFESDASKLYYSEDELKWAEDNEEEIWSFFVEKDLVFSTNQSLKDRFIDLAPYSKFYLELDNDSSPRIGKFIGWQIVRRFMQKNPNTKLKELLKMKADVIFELSNYKP